MNYEIKILEYLFIGIKQREYFNFYLKRIHLKYSNHFQKAHNKNKRESV